MILEDRNKEDRFLKKIANRLGRPTPEKISLREVVGPPEFWAKQRPADEDLMQEFITNAEKLTVRTGVVRTPEEAQGQIADWLTEMQAKSVMAWDLPELKRIGVPEACTRAGSPLAYWNAQADRQEMIRLCASVDVGITWADYGIANTGSLGILTSSVQSRSVSLLPPVHLAIIKRSSILPHMSQIFAAIDQQKLPSSITFVTGPSRTSDIEMDLALGVHGPGKVFILVLDMEI